MNVSELKQEHAGVMGDVKKITSDSTIALVDQVNAVFDIMQPKLDHPVFEGPSIYKGKSNRKSWQDNLTDSDTPSEISMNAATILHIIERNLANDLKTGNPLAKVLDYTSGSSWDGSHWRTVDVITEGDSVVVQNSYQGHVVSEEFTRAGFAEAMQDDVVKHMHYYKEAAPQLLAALEA